MEQNELLQRQCKMLSCLSGLPRRMLGLHGADNVTEFVLYDLCQKDCFNLTKAAYFVDNPDFNCTKGVAGFSREERGDSCNIWENPHGFSSEMQGSQFNNKVRSVASCSLKKGGNLHDELAKNIARDLDFKNYAYCTWNMKHDNHGFVLYEKADAHDAFADEHLLNGLSLLSYCPIF